MNSLRTKLETFKQLVQGNPDIVVVSEVNIDSSFPLKLFSIDSVALPFKKDRTINAGGIIIYVMSCKEARCANINTDNFAGVFKETNLRRTKWLLFAGYNPSKTSIDTYIRTLSHILDYHMIKYENLIILGDFNSETKEASMTEFCDLYNLNSLITSHLYF